jgi:hypothetical protein
MVQMVHDRHPEAAKIDADAVTDILVAFVDGLGLHGLIYPEHVPAERIRALLDAQVRALLVIDAD